MNRKPLIKKFLSDQCSAEEAKQVFSWLQEDPHLLDDLISEDDWTSYTNGETKASSSWGMGVKVLLICVFLGLVASLFQLKRDAPVITIQETLVAKPFQIFYNPFDTIKEYVLADQSHVRLQPGAMIQVDIKADQQIRHVRLLEGEAFFKVAKDVSRPFVVQTQALKTTALGTEFIVSYNGDQEKVSVKLLEGKVKVEQGGEKYKLAAKVLVPGQQVESIGYATMSLSQFPASKETQRSGLAQSNNEDSSPTVSYHYPTSIHDSGEWLLLDETSLSDIIQYINYELDNPIAYDSLMLRNYRIKGRFKKNVTMSAQDKDLLANSILQLIVEMNPFELNKKYNTYILKSKK